MWCSASVAATLILTTACGAEPADGTTEITFMPYQSMEVMEPIIDAFHEQNPDIQVTASPSAEGYGQTLQTRIAGGQTPDVFQIVAENRNEILSNDLALSLTGEDFLGSVDPAFLDLYTVDGETYAITFTAWMGGLIYNRDLLAQAGYDEFPTTWDEFVEMGEALAAEGTIPLLEEQAIPSGSLTALLGSYHAAQGLDTGEYGIDGKPQGTTFAESWEPALREWQRAVDAGVLTEDSLSLDAQQIKAAFLSGQTAVYRSGNWDLADLRASGVDFGVAPFPAFPGSVPFINGGGDPAYAISAQSAPEQQEAAKRFLAFLASAEGVQLLVEGQGAQSISDAYTSDPGDEFRDLYENSLLPGNFFWIEWSRDAAVMAQTMTQQQQLVILGDTDPAGFTTALDAAVGD